MFRALLCPSLGARDYDVDFLIGRVILGLLCVGGKVQLGWSSVRVSGLRKDTVSIVQEAGWAPRPVWTGGKFCPHRDSIPDRPARSQSLYRLSCAAHS